MAADLTRLTLYALISAIEHDLRTLIRSYVAVHPDPATVYSPELQARLLIRAGARSEDSHDAWTSADLVDFLDLGDTFAMLNQNKSCLPEETASHLKAYTPRLESLVAIRNRVMHGRPLDPEDLVATLDLQTALREALPSCWSELTRIYGALADPGFLLSLPFAPSEPSSKIFTNLPYPDFDETGYVGRSEDVAAIKALCLGPFPVISLIGDGGVGKTSTALKVAYSLLDDPTCPFDAIIWATSKTTQLSANEILEITDAISDSLGIFTHLRNTVAGDMPGDPESELLAYMSEFPMLLILDNLETVLDERVRSFLRRLPLYSKVLITSRIGLGELENRYQLLAMRPTEAARLLRAIAKVRNVNAISHAKEEALVECCKRLGHNPGYLKWFVSVLQTGVRPEDALRDTRLFLEYCMSNVYHYLDECSRTLIAAMLCDREPQTVATLVYITEMTVKDIQPALMQLMRTSMVVMRSDRLGSVFETTYELGLLARQYLERIAPANEDFARRVRWRRSELRRSVELRNFGVSRLSGPTQIELRSPNDVVVAGILKGALKLSQDGDFDAALRSVDQARSLTPDYWEVWRVEACIRTHQGNIPLAKQLYENALDLEKNASSLAYWYGCFLVKHYDAREALHWFLRAKDLSGDDPEIDAEIGRARLYLGEFEVARLILDDCLQAPQLRSLTKQKAHDLRLQVELREGEALEANGDALGALRCLKRFREKFEEVSEKLRDQRIMMRLNFARSLAVKLERWLGDSDEMCYEFAAWAISRGASVELGKAGQERGFVSELRAGATFGFVEEANTGERYFFCRAFMRIDREWEQLGEGSTVSFDIGRNRTGICAVNVSIVE